jgi:serine protease Do
VGSAPAQLPSELSHGKFLGRFRDIVAKSNESTVRIRCNDRDAALGTVVDADGYILTKASELRGAVSVRLAGGAEQEAQVVAVHRETDLALIKVGVKGLKPVTFADSKKAALGSWLAAAGPGSDPTAVGVVSVLTHTFSKAEAQRIENFNRGFLGVTFEPKDNEGAVVATVTEKGAGEKAGLKKKDVICAVDDKEIPSQAALRQLLAESQPGDKFTLKVKREGKELKVPVTLTRQPLATLGRSDIQNEIGGSLSGRRTGFPAVLQSDMVLDPHNCGGPVVDLDGNVLGIVIARAGRVETWILPGENIRPLLADMKAGKFPLASAKKEAAK